MFDRIVIILFRKWEKTSREINSYDYKRSDWLA